MNRNASKTRLAVTYIVLGIMCVVWLIPIAWIVLQALSQSKGMSAKFIPSEWTLDNFIYLFKDDNTGYKYSSWFVNTLVVAVASALITTLFTLSTAYVMSRFRFKSRRLFMNLALILGMFPGFMSMIAVYFLLKQADMLNLSGLVVVYSSGAALAFYIGKGFFDTVPKTLDEAARIDGASSAAVFFKIILPLSKPIVIYTVLTSFLAPWADFMFASYILKNNSDDFTVAVGLYNMLLGNKENINLFFGKFAAGAVITALPVSILFMFMQRYYVDGVTGGAVKG